MLSDLPKFSRSMDEIRPPHPNGPWRDRHFLVVRHGSVLPNRCAICGAEANDQPVTMAFARQQGVGIIGGIVADVIDGVRGAQYTGPVSATFYFCKGHGGRRKRLWFVMLVLTLISTAWLIEYSIYGGRNDPMFFIPLMLLIPCVTCGIFLIKCQLNPWFNSKRFEHRDVWLKGSHFRFLQTLPNYGQ
ncbi:MAG: hypothetical protein JWL69_1627 [Phycisphaerales bacterium]|nr:hypothetical protein [Phycisphaerales bacterium]